MAAIEARLHGGPYDGEVMPVNPGDLDTGITITYYPIRNGLRAHTARIDRYRYRTNSLDLVARRATMDWEPPDPHPNAPRLK